MAKNDSKTNEQEQERAQQVEQPGDVPDIHEQAQRVLSGESVGVTHESGTGLGPDPQPAADEEPAPKSASKSTKANGAAGTESK